MDVFDQIATGVRPPPPPPSARAINTLPSLQAQQLLYALAKQVPAMARGFTIATSYGDIVIEPGRHADAIAATVRCALEAQHKALAGAAAKALRAAHAGAAA